MKSAFSSGDSPESNSLKLDQTVESAGQLRSAKIAHRIDAGTIFVVLPAYNEAKNLPSLLTKIQLTFAANGRDYHVIVVDDASTDDTAEIAAKASFQMPFTLVQHQTNQNLPGALRSGFAEANRMAVEGDVIVTMDGDDTHQPGTINRMVQLIEDGFDVSIASRFQPGARVVGVPPLRVFMAWAARIIFRIIMPIPGVRDYSSGYRAYRAGVLRKAMEFYGNEFISEPGFSCMADVLLKMRRFGFLIGEVPMVLRYDQKHGDSKMNVSNTAWQSLKLLLKRRLGGF